MVLHNAAVTGSLTVNGTDVSSITGSSTYSASFASQITSLNAATASLNTYTSSNNTNISALNAQSASFLAYTASNDANVISAFANISSLSAGSASSAFNVNALSNFSASMLSYTASSNVKFAGLDAASGSAITRLTSLENRTGSYATTGSNTFVGGQYFSSSLNPTGFTTTASLYTDGGLRVTKDAYISGTLYLNNVTVFGTQSIAYISSSQLNIGTNIITVNTDTPSVRFGGLAVYDSGSTGLTGSMLWDSQNNHWIYSNPSGSSYSGGMFISGPRTSTLGSETGTTSCMLLAGQGGDHLTSSMIYHSSTVTCIPTAIAAGSTACFAGNLNACSSVNVGLNLRISTSTSAGNATDPAITTGGCTKVGVYFDGGCVGLGSGGNTLILTQTGKVGIGTQSPDYGNLSIYCVDNTPLSPSLWGTSATSGVTTAIYNGSQCANSVAGLRLITRDSGASIWNIYNVSTGPAEGALAFGNGTGGTGYERLRITNDGITCFACTVCAPAFVGGTISGTSATFSGNIITTGATAEIMANGAGSSNTVGGSSRFTILDSSNTRGWILQQNASYNLSFWHFNGGWSNIINFTPSGAVTLSSTIAATSATFSSDFLSNETSKVGIAFESGYGKINAWGANTSTYGGLKFQISVSNGGTLNALTIAPTGAATFASSITTGDVLQLGSGGAGGGVWTWGGGDAYIYSPNGKNLWLSSGDSGTNGIKITTAGSVGIGTATIPSDRILQVHSSCAYARMALTNASTGVASGDGLIFQMENCVAIIKNQETSCLILGANGRETDIVINQNGGVGIGQSPINKFTILAGNSNVLDLFDTGAGFGIGMQAMNSAATVYRSWDFYASKYQFFSGQAIFSCTVCAPTAIFTGCVGIGQTSPAFGLEVYSSKQTAITSDNTFGANFNVIFNRDNTGGTRNCFNLLADQNAAYLRTLNNYPINFVTNGQNRLLLSSTGEACFACRPSFPGANLICSYTCTYSSYTAGCWLGLFAGDNGYNGAYAFTVVGQFTLSGTALYSMNYSTVPYIHSSTSLGSTNGNDFYALPHTSAGHADNGTLVCFRRVRYSGNTPAGNRTEFCMNATYNSSFTATTYVLAWV